MNHINQLLVQAQKAYEARDYSLLASCLIELILESELVQAEISSNREYLTELALFVLENGNFQQRWHIAKVFPKLGTNVIPGLVGILKDEEACEELRWYAGGILGEFKQKEAITALVELIKTENDEYPELSTMAVTALGNIGTSAIEMITELITEEKTRLLAVKALFYIRSPQTIEPLLTVVKNTDIFVRVTAIEALSSFHDQRIPPVLLKALDDVAPLVRRQAILGLGFRPDLARELDLVNKLQPKLYDFNEDVCYAAIDALSRMNHPESAKYLFDALVSSNTSEKLQLQIIRALSWMEISSGLEYLQQALYKLESSVLWQEIVTVLGRVSESNLSNYSGDILLPILLNNHPAGKISSIKSALALSLGKLGYKQAIDPLKQMLVDEDRVVRLHAAAALKYLTASSSTD